jgi:two-component system chemotaxis response regulator CheB
MTVIRVLVVEDSLTVRKRLCEILAASPGIEVVGEAEDGKRAIELCLALRPDVITLDMILPVMSGLAATEYIMAYCPTPILIVSSSTNRGELFKTYEALAAGAVDVLEKYGDETPAEAWEENFISTVRLVSRIRVITHPRARLSRPSAPRVLPSAKETPRPGKEGFAVAAVGASTGGPSAIVEVLRGLPSGFSLPMIFVLHIGEPFARTFAEWLDGQTSRHVTYAQDGQEIGTERGTVLMAPPDRHLTVREGRIRLTRDAERHSCRPSVDVMFESVAGEYGPEAIACLMTGMGRDGASGLLAVKNAGGFTIAQDESTSVVYGMPREAALLGAADTVLPLGEIGPVLGSLAALGRKALR